MPARYKLLLVAQFVGPAALSCPASCPWSSGVMSSCSMLFGLQILLFALDPHCHAGAESAYAPV